MSQCDCSLRVIARFLMAAKRVTKRPRARAHFLIRLGTTSSIEWLTIDCSSSSHHYAIPTVTTRATSPRLPRRVFRFERLQHPSPPLFSPAPLQQPPPPPYPNATLSTMHANSRKSANPHSRGRGLTDDPSIHTYGTNASSSTTGRQRNKVKAEWICPACCYVCAGNNESCPVCRAVPAASKQENPSVMAPPAPNTSPKSTSPKMLKKGSSKTTSKVSTRRKVYIKSSQEPTAPTPITPGGDDKALKKSPSSLNNVKLIRRKKTTMFRREDDSGDVASEQPGRAYRRHTSPVPPPRSKDLSDDRRADSQMRYSDRPTKTSPSHVVEFAGFQPDHSINVEISDFEDSTTNLEDSIPAPAIRDLRPVRTTFNRSRSAASNQEQGSPHDRSETSLSMDHGFYPNAERVTAFVTDEEAPASPPQQQQESIPQLRQEEPLTPTSPAPRPTLQERHQQQEDTFLGWTPEEQVQSWICGACTFENENALHLTCSLCSTLRVKDASHRTPSDIRLAEQPLGDDSQEAAIRCNSELIGEDWLETLQQERIQELIEIQEELLLQYNQ